MYLQQQYNQMIRWIVSLFVTLGGHKKEFNNVTTSSKTTKSLSKGVKGLVGGWG